MISPFIIPAIIAMAFCSLLYPLHKKVLKICKQRNNLASLISTLFIIIIFVIPASILISLLANQLTHLYNSVEPIIYKISHSTENEILSELNKFKFFHFLKSYNVDWISILMTSGNKILSLLSVLINNISQSIFQFIVNLLITFFCMFYFFRDGNKLLSYLETISPLQKEHEEKLFNNFTKISRATVKGTLLIGALQGSLGAITLLLFGVKTWLLWGFIMIICSIIPVIGAWVVLVPISIFFMIKGSFWSGVSIFLISTLIISNVDNLIRPYLVGKEAKMHDLMIFFSTLGGIAMFGVMGFIIGPVIASLFIALLSIYKDEFKDRIS
jgi:predicted PurR-regulated permease PerM